jgi:hypothetical protein
MTDHQNEPDWTIRLQGQPADLSTGTLEDDTAMYELICRYCGDDPDLDYRQIPVGLRQIRGPYPLQAGVAAFLTHNESHHGTEETRNATPGPA